MSYPIHAVLRACLTFGMSEAERDTFERILRFPHTGPKVLEHSKFTNELYIKLRDMGMDDVQVLSVLEAIE
jgi:hypothetical protein